MKRTRHYMELDSPDVETMVGTTDEETVDSPSASATVEVQACATNTACSGSWHAQHHTATRLPVIHIQPPPGVPQQHGCYVGTPIFSGTPAVALPTDRKALFQLAMRCVECDDYHCIFELARVGLHEAFDERRRCGFICNLKPGVRVNFAGAPIPPGHHWLNVKSANLLQYATFIGAFRAALALLVICPTHLKTQCEVTLCSELSDKDPAWTVKWGAAELARFLCSLYSLEAAARNGQEVQSEVIGIGEMFCHALCVYEIGEARPASLPFLALPTTSDRIKAAGADPALALAAVCAAAGINICGSFGKLPGV